MTAAPLALVVDDSVDQAELLRRYLERAGCEVLTAESAERALELLTDVAPAIAVVDLILPGIPGDEFAERLRASNPDCLLVISSVLDRSRYPEADAVLPKPFTRAEVARIVEQAASHS